MSCDSAYAHLAWANMERDKGGLGKLKIPLVSDFDKSIARSYGVLLPDGMPLRALFLISPEGIVRQITVNDLSVGRSVDESIRLLQAFQFTDTYGEVCPANWQPGHSTIKADPVGARAYFSNVQDLSVAAPHTGSVSIAGLVQSALGWCRCMGRIKATPSEIKAVTSCVIWVARTLLGAVAVILKSPPACRQISRDIESYLAQSLKLSKPYTK